MSIMLQFLKSFHESCNTRLNSFSESNSQDQSFTQFYHDHYYRTRCVIINYLIPFYRCNHFQYNKLYTPKEEQNKMNIFYYP